MELEVKSEVAFELKLQEYDKKIADAEFEVASLKKQKMDYIYNKNVKIVIEQATKEKLAKADIKSLGD